MLHVESITYPSIEKGMLYLVATPIGNLSDITLRALHVLKNVDMIFCEDTRLSRQLLKTYDIKTPLHIYHDHSTDHDRHTIIRHLQSKKSIALISDAGTPLIADPGYKLVARCREKEIPMTLIPGPCALIGGLVLSGAPTHTFHFSGFLPLKTKDRHALMKEWQSISCPIVLYETGQKLLKTLEDFLYFFPTRDLALVRELTKKFEEVRRGSLESMLSYYKDHGPPKGEIVLVLEGGEESSPPPLVDSRCLRHILTKMGLREAAEFLSKLLKKPKNDLYKELLKVKNES